MSRSLAIWFAIAVILVAGTVYAVIVSVSNSATSGVGVASSSGEDDALPCAHKESPDPLKGSPSTSGESERIDKEGQDSESKARDNTGDRREWLGAEFREVPDGDGVPPKDANENAPEELSPEEQFIAEVMRLANAEDWNALSDFLRKAISEASPLEEFIPLLVAALEAIDDRVGYVDVGRWVQASLGGHNDLFESKEARKVMKRTYLDSESPLVLVGFAGPLSAAMFHSGDDTTALRLHTEKLLDDRRIALNQAVNPHEQFTLIRQLLWAHYAFSSTILDTIIYVDQQRSQQFSWAVVRYLWDYCCASAFAYDRYSLADVEAITRFLIAHTDRSLRDKNASAKEIKRLKKIWATFNEQHAYEEGMRHAESLTDEMMQGAYDQILAHWLTENGNDESQGSEGE